MKESKDLLIVGAGETACLAYEYFAHDSNYNVIAFAVDRAYLGKESLFDLPVITVEDIPKKYETKSLHLFVAIGSGKLNRNRTEMYLSLKALGYRFASYVSSKAFVWHNVDIGENCFILEHNTLQPFVRVGNNVTLWSGNHVGHRTVVSDHCFISSHCVISGFCKIGEGCFLGVNCTLEDHVEIGKDNFIGSNALIRKNTESKCFYQDKQTDCSKASTHRFFGIKEL